MSTWHYGRCVFKQSHTDIRSLSCLYVSLDSWRPLTLLLGSVDHCCYFEPGALPQRLRWLSCGLNGTVCLCVCVCVWCLSTVTSSESTSAARSGSWYKTNMFAPGPWRICLLCENQIYLITRPRASVSRPVSLRPDCRCLLLRLDSLITTHPVLKGGALLTPCTD